MSRVPQKVVVCGAGFLGSNIAKTLALNHSVHRYNARPPYDHERQIRLVSRSPQRLFESLRAELLASPPPSSSPNDPIPPGHPSPSSPSEASRAAAARLVHPIPANITQPHTLAPAFAGADIVISLVGILQGTPHQFDAIQWKGAENVARAAKDVGAKLIHVSAIGADKGSQVHYWRTKGLGEQAVFDVCKDATVLRPSIVFGPGDGFFTRFATLSKFLPFLPVFGAGKSQFQPIYVGDLARAVEITSRISDPEVRAMTDGKIIEVGGPDVYTYRYLMMAVLKCTMRTRFILPLPYAIGKMQASILERLPPNILTITRDQVEQLKYDNKVTHAQTDDRFTSFEELMHKFSGEELKSVYDILPLYL